MYEIKEIKENTLFYFRYAELMASKIKKTQLFSNRMELSLGIQGISKIIVRKISDWMFFRILSSNQTPQYFLIMNSINQSYSFIDQ